MSYQSTIFQYVCLVPSGRDDRYCGNCHSFNDDFALRNGQVSPLPSLVISSFDFNPSVWGIHANNRKLRSPEFPRRPVISGYHYLGDFWKFWSLNFRPSGCSGTWGSPLDGLTAPHTGISFRNSGLTNTRLH